MFQLPSHQSSREEMFLTQISENAKVVRLLAVHPPVHPSLEEDGSNSIIASTVWIIFKSGMPNDDLEEFAS